MAEALDPQSKSLLERKLSTFRPLDLCLRLADRLFQKAPELNGQLQTLLSRCEAKTSLRLYAAQRFVLQRITAAVDGTENHGLPRRMENFLSFLDLAWIVLNVEERSKMTWNTFVLQDFNIAANVALPVAKLRRRLKQFIPETHLASVQIDIDDPATPSSSSSRAAAVFVREQLNTTRVFFRIAVIPKSKSGRNDERNLMKKPATFLVYYPNEPYFFSDKAQPDAIVCQALCSCLHSSDYVSIPLSGPHLESLRQLRQNRDKKKTKQLSNFKEHNNLENEIIHVLGSAVDHESDSNENHVPHLNKLTLVCPAEFQAKSVLHTFHGGRLPIAVDNLDLKISFRSNNVFGSLRHFTTNEKSSVLKRPAPNWVESAINRGRNVIKLRKVERTRDDEDEEDGGNGSQEDINDNVSVAGSEMTVMVKR